MTDRLETALDGGSALSADWAVHENVTVPGVSPRGAAAIEPPAQDILLGRMVKVARATAHSQAWGLQQTQWEMACHSFVVKVACHAAYGWDDPVLFQKGGPSRCANLVYVELTGSGERAKEAKKEERFGEGFSADLQPPGVIVLWPIPNTNGACSKTTGYGHSAIYIGENRVVTTPWKDTIREGRNGIHECTLEDMNALLPDRRVCWYIPKPSVPS